MLDYNFKLHCHTYYCLLPSEKDRMYSKVYLIDMYLKISLDYRVLIVKPYHLTRLPKEIIIVLLDHLIYTTGLNVYPT